MTGRLRRPVVSLLAAVALLVALAGGAAGETVSRAAVVVDLGSEVRTARITFTGEISGLEALQLAGFDPVVRAFGGTGGAVCAICDHGCPADASCLTCGGGNYWAYFRAPAGATSYTYSPAGAGATRVRDGDVEAWKWGRGNPPRFVSFAEVWGIPATTTTAAPPATASRPPATAAPQPPAAAGTPSVVPPDQGEPGGGAEPPGGATPSGPGDGGRRAGDERGPTSIGPTTTDQPADAAATSVPSSRAPSTTAPSGDTNDATDDATDDSVAIAPEFTSGEGGGGSPAALAAFGVVVAGLGAWIVVAHRRRVRASGTGAGP